KSHRHPNNFFSGTYYASLPEGADGIQFMDPRSQMGLLMPQPDKLNKHNSGKITLPVREGDLMLWMSWFEHAVPPNPSTEDRYTASFNLMFSNFTERHTSPIIQRVVDSL
ncbi:MAG: TIGR02466 family protein, partial [Gammaproteobacteria bacterium]